MEKHPRHLLAGADLGKRPVFRPIEVDGERLAVGGEELLLIAHICRKWHHLGSVQMVIRHSAKSNVTIAGMLRPAFILLVEKDQQVTFPEA
jgi:hypothetical protein